MSQPETSIDELLVAVGTGDSTAQQQLFERVYQQLHRQAELFMRQERGNHTLQPTALIHEAFLKLFPAAGSRSPHQFDNIHHFFATAAKVMRQILINHARAKNTLKRGGQQSQIDLGEVAAEFERNALDMLALDDALVRLKQVDPTQAQIVELRFFAGLTNTECAQLLGISERTVYYEWSHARAWLRQQLATE